MRGKLAKALRKAENNLVSELDVHENSYKEVTFHKKKKVFPVTGDEYTYYVVNPIKLIPNCKRDLYQKLKKQIKKGKKFPNLGIK